MKRIFIQSLCMAALAWVAQLLFPADVAMAWIGTAIGAGLGVLSSLYGGAKSADAEREAQRMLDQKEARDNAWYKRRYNQDYLDTKAGRNLVNQYLAAGNKLLRRNESVTRTGGLSLARSAADKDRVIGGLQKTISSIGATDEARKDGIDRQHQTNMNAITQQRINAAQQKANNITYAASQASNSLMQAGSALDKGDDDFWDGLTRGKKKNNNSNSGTGEG